VTCRYATLVRLLLSEAGRRPRLSETLPPPDAAGRRGGRWCAAAGRARRRGDRRRGRPGGGLPVVHRAAADLGVRAIADAVGRAPSTISGELRRSTVAHDAATKATWHTCGLGSERVDRAGPG
jgi:hypothetical protein